MPDGQVVFEITSDGGKKAIEGVKNVTSAIQTESKKWDKLTDESTENMGQSFADVAKQVAAAFSAAKVGSMLLDWGKAAVSAASDLAEVQNVVDVTFGESASKIESWSKIAGQQFGLTETQAKQFTSTLGAMMKSAGMSGDEIVEMSTDLAGLAADMASFYNLDFETAFQKIRSGISGETEPLKQLGINMSVANLEAYALEKGITKAFAAMSQQEQTVLRYQYLMQATADAQGDFARTSDGFANATRRMQTALNTISTAAGSVILTAIEPLISKTAELMSALTATPKETLFDRLKSININRDAKIKEIEDVSFQAQNLIDKMSLIAGTDADQAIEKLAKGANSLDSSAPGIWTSMFNALQSIDGLHNLFSGDNQAGTNISSLVSSLTSAELGEDKVNAWKKLLDAFGDNSAALSALTGKGEEGTKEWLAGLAESVNSIDPNDAAAWDKLLTTLVSGFSGNTEAGKQFFETMTEQFLAMGKDSDVAINGLEALGFTSEQITDKQEQWLKTCQDLIRTIPGLSEVVNAESGEIQGGIGTLETYVEEWKTAQEKLAYWKAFYAKKQAVAETQGNLYGLEITAGGAQTAANNYLSDHPTIRSVYDRGGMQGVKDYGGKEAQEFYALWKTAKEAQEEYQTALVQTQAATKQLESEEQYLTERFGEYTETVTDAGEAATEWSSEQVTAAQTAAQGLENALKNVETYVQNMRASTAQAVESIVSGFTQIVRPTTAVNEQISELNEQLHNGTITSEEYQKKADALKDSLNAFSVKTMSESLESQMSFMKEYMENLEFLQGKNLSAGFLAEFADGSKESAERLSQIVESIKTDEETGMAQVKALDEQYQQLQEKKSEFVDALAQQKLEADQTFADMQQTIEDAYKAMVEAAGTAADGMDVSAEIQTSMSNNVAAIASAISSHTDEVKTAVDGIISQLDRLNNFGVHINLGSGGGVSFSLSLNGSHATGLDFVPFDGYLAELHEGEGILTAEENRIWQRFKNGDAGTRNVDYETIGSVFADSIKPGGDVYLDGRVVGSVISQQQARSYRTLQRSGWQA